MSALLKLTFFVNLSNRGQVAQSDLVSWKWSCFVYSLYNPDVLSIMLGQLFLQEKGEIDER